MMKRNIFFVDYLSWVPFFLPFFFIRISQSITSGDLFITLISFYFFIKLEIYKSKIFILSFSYISILEIVNILFDQFYDVSLITFLKILISVVFFISIFKYISLFRRKYLSKVNLSMYTNINFSIYLLILVSYYFLLSIFGDLLPFKNLLIDPNTSPFLDSVNAAIYCMVINSFAMYGFKNNSNIGKIVTISTILLSILLSIYIGSRSCVLIICLSNLLFFLFSNFKKKIFPKSQTKLISFIPNIILFVLMFSPFIILLNLNYLINIFENLLNKFLSAKFLVPLQLLADDNKLLDILFNDTSFQVRQINISRIFENTSFYQWIFGGGSNSISRIQLLSYSNSVDNSYIEFMHKFGLLGLFILFLFLFTLFLINPIIGFSISLYIYIQDISSNSSTLLQLFLLSIVLLTFRLRFINNYYRKLRKF